MNVPWKGASRVIYKPEIGSVFCLFPSRLCVYRLVEDTWPGELIRYIPLEIVDFDVRPMANTNKQCLGDLVFLDTQGVCWYIYLNSSLVGWGDYSPAITPLSSSLPPGIMSVQFFGTAWAFSFLENGQEKLCFSAYPWSTNSEEAELTFITSSWGVSLDEKPLFLDQDGWLNYNGCIAFSQLPEEINCVGSISPRDTQGTYTLGSSYFSQTEAQDKLQLSRYSSGQFFNTEFSSLDSVAYAVDETIALLTYTNTYELYSYNPGSTVFERVTAFNPAEEALPNHTFICVNKKKSKGLAVSGNSLLLISLLDGAYVVIDTGGAVTLFGKQLVQEEEGAAFFYFLTSDATQVKRLNLETEELSSLSIDFEVFRAIITTYLPELNSSRPLKGCEVITQGGLSIAIQGYVGMSLVSLGYVHYSLSEIGEPVFLAHSFSSASPGLAPLQSNPTLLGPKAVQAGSESKYPVAVNFSTSAPFFSSDFGAGNESDKPVTKLLIALLVDGCVLTFFTEEAGGQQSYFSSQSAESKKFLPITEVKGIIETDEFYVLLTIVASETTLCFLNKTWLGLSGVYSPLRLGFRAKEGLTLSLVGKSEYKQGEFTPFLQVPLPGAEEITSCLDNSFLILYEYGQSIAYDVEAFIE